MRNPFTSATFAHHFHAAATVAWIMLVIPSVLWWKESIPWIVFMSVWANVVGHWSSYQATAAQLEAKDDPG